MPLQPIEKISEGFSNQYLVQGVAVSAAGLLCFLINSYLVLPILLVGIGLLAVRTGVLIDTKAHKYKLYRAFFGISLGKWKSLENTQKVVIQLNSEQSTISGLTPGIGTYRGASIKTRTYDLYLSDGLSKELLNDFLTYKSAHRTAIVISETMNIELRDKIADKISQNRSKRRR